MRMLGLLAALALALTTPAAAQDYPAKPIRIVVPFGPGTATDIVARTVGSEIASRTGQAVVTDNKPGAEGQIGAQTAAAAAPDGYTLFITTQTTQAINIHVYKSLPYDPVKSFAPLSGLSLGAQVVMVKSELPVKTIGELIALARAQPGKLSFGSGNGSGRGGARALPIHAAGATAKTPPGGRKCPRRATKRGRRAQRGGRGRRLTCRGARRGPSSTDLT